MNKNEKNVSHLFALKVCYNDEDIMNWREWCGDAIIVPVNAG